MPCPPDWHGVHRRGDACIALLALGDNRTCPTISTSTIARRTKIVPRWMAVFGYILAVVLILSIGLIEWAAVVLPLWVLMVSLYILVEDLLGWPRVAPELKPQP